MDYKIFNSLFEYQGDNSYLNKLKRKKLSKVPLNEFEESYVEYSLNFKGRSFKALTLDNLTENDKKHIKESYGTSKEITTLKINKLLGENNTHYHLGYKNSKKLYEFFIEKTFDIEKAVYNNVEVDFSMVNDMLPDGKSLYPHQELASKFLLYAKKCFLFDGAGVGKTYASIAAALLSDSERILIVCLSGLKINWKKEISMFVDPSEIRIINGRTDWIDGDHRFTIINFDVISAYTGIRKIKKKGAVETRQTQLLEEQFDCVILDEAHRAKGMTTQVGESIKRLSRLPSTKYVWALTATPFEKPYGLYMLALNCGIQMGDLIFPYPNKAVTDAFKLRYCAGFKIEKNGREIVIEGRTKAGGVKVMASNIYDLATRMKFKKLRRTLRDVFPDFVDIYREKMVFELNGKQRKKYHKLFEEYNKKSIEERNVDLTAVIVQGEPIDLSKLVEPIILQQWLAIQMTKETAAVAKSEASMGKKVLIFTHFNEENNELIKLFNSGKREKALLVHASMTSKKQDEQIQKFKSKKQYQFLVGNIKTLGTGHNIQVADVIIKNSIDWNSGEHEQAEGRAWRIGREDDVEVIYMLYEDTISEVIFERCFGKQQDKLKLIGGNSRDYGFEEE